MTEKKPDLGNTRINGFSEGLARGSKLTGRISRAVSIGEDVMRQNGAAFDSHTRKNAAGDTYFCPDCRAWMSDATVGVHDRRNPTHSSQVRDAAGNLKGAHWAKEERANADPRAEREDKISALEKKGGDAWAEYENLAKQAEREKDASRKSQLTDQARAKKKESYAAQSAAMELKRQRHNAGDSAKAIIVQSGGGATGWIIADSEGRRLHGPFPSYSAAEADFKRRNLEMANAGDRPAGAIYKSLGEIKKQIAMCKEDLTMYEKSGKDREAKAMRADIKELEADYAHDAPLWEKHNAGDTCEVVEEAKDDFAIFKGGKKVREGLHKDEVKAALEEVKSEREKHNAGDEGFLSDTMSGMDVDAGQAQEGLAPAEDADVLANSKAGVKRGAQKYGKI